jgi:hypothetical protein
MNTRYSKVISWSVATGIPLMPVTRMAPAKDAVQDDERDDSDPEVKDQPRIPSCDPALPAVALRHSVHVRSRCSRLTKAGA